jgi:hypothetical protein
MSRFFFDVVTTSGGTSLALRGASFAALQQARDTAEMIGLDVAIPEDSARIGPEVQLRDEAGNCILLAPFAKLIRNSSRH